MKKLIGYITPKIPDNNFTIDLANTMLENGVDFLELGIPFSDPVADGALIEKANYISLRNNFKLRDLFEISEGISTSEKLYWMGYFNSFFNYGIPEICQKASQLNLKGFLIPDLPLEESLKYEEVFQENSLDLITFIAPTDKEERIKTLLKNPKGFLYLVSYTGVTGKGRNENLHGTIANIRKYSDLPLYVGFGVNEKTAKKKSENADGVIVGSAFVKVLLDRALTNSEKIDTIARLSREIKEQINS